ncbi:MAG: thioredoxin fold domain-containing protein [Stagnimonas sp.]|nr:thioredoxin fold domain-containing protein [Stagnimonas sp.]
MALLTHAAQASSLDEVKAKMQASYGEITVEKTPFEEIYTYYPTANPEQAGVRLTTSDLSARANDGKNRGWQHRDGGGPLPDEEVTKLRQAAVSQLPMKDALLFIKKAAPVGVMIYSAVDCGACVVLEQILSKSNLSYGVFPWALSGARLPIAEDVWCDVNPQKAWSQLMLKRELVTQRRATECVYPKANIAAVGSMFGYRQTPTIILADGSTIQMDDDPVVQKKMIATIRENVRKGIVFKTTP